MQYSIGVIGASGFAGSEVLRLVAAHPHFEIAWATADSQAGVRIADLYPSLAGAYPNQVFVSFEEHLLDHVDAVVLGLPHGASQSVVPTLEGRVERVIDLAADFRLKDPDLYPKWYGEPHTRPELLDEFVYGIPELYRSTIAGARNVAAPGCYPTATILGLAPFATRGLLGGSKLIVDAASGVSGAGRPPRDNTTFCAVDENYTAYGLLTHRHTPEMEAHLGMPVIFTPHLAPMNRGILVTAYADVPTTMLGELTTESMLEVLADSYADEPFVVVDERPPSTKAAQGSNCAHVSVRVDQRTQTIIVMSAIDNLVKGTAGQALQCLNLMVGIDEPTGLPRVGVTP